MKEFDINTGGPAHPSVLHGPCEAFGMTAKDNQILEFTGITIRDYFAAKAMQAQLARTTWGIEDDARDTAKEAYAYADAMLEARK